MSTVSKPRLDSLHRKDDKDYECILSEIERFVGMTTKDLMDYFRLHPQDGLCTVPRPNGGTLPFTRAGQRRFLQVATRGLDAIGPEAWKYDVARVMGALKSEFMSALVGHANITVKNAHDIFERALLASASDHRELVHYIPCIVVGHWKTQVFTIGPVQFVYRERFLKENESALRARPRSAVGRDWTLEELETFFSQFLWVASISVPACDESCSKERARRVVQRALDIFKLFVGSRRASHVRQAYDLRSQGVSSYLVSSPQGEFSVGYRRATYDAVLNDDWYEISEWETWKLAEDIVQREFNPLSPLTQPESKFISGLEWHGDAISEPNPQSRVLKFWTAIEQTLSNSFHGDSVKRAALLSCGTPAGFSETFKRYDALYGKRASVLHGLKSPSRSVEEKRFALDVEKISKSVLLNFLLMLKALRARGNLTAAAVDSEFKRRLQLCKSARPANSGSR